MTAQVNIDGELLTEAVQLGGFQSEREAVHEALRAYILRQKRLSLLSLEGTFEEFDSFDHKPFRN